MNMDINIHILGWVCPCGTRRAHVQVGTSSLGELVAKWQCAKCNEFCLVRIPMEEVIAGIPKAPPPLPLLVAPTPSPYTAEDLRLLTDMHISLEGETNG